MDYLGLNISLNAYLKDDIKFEPEVNVDESVRKYRKEIYDKLVEAGISDTILDIIFVKDSAIQKSMTDLEYLEVMKKGLTDKSIADVATMYLDFYTIEHSLRRHLIPKIEGSHLNHYIKNEEDSLDSVLLKSMYYQWIGSITLDNYRKMFDEYLFSNLKKNRYVNIGLDGVISRVIRNLLVVENRAIIEKAVRMHLDGRDFVRSYDE